MYENIEILLGKTIKKINVYKYNAEIQFVCEDGKTYRMRHHQDCCESVEIDDICGELENLIGEPILQAEETSSEENPKKGADISFKWTFYKLATIKGYVTIRWFGTSNGYYGESVDFEEE